MKVSLATAPVVPATPAEPAFPYLARINGTTIWLVVDRGTADEHRKAIAVTGGLAYTLGEVGQISVLRAVPLKPGEQVILEND